MEKETFSLLTLNAGLALARLFGKTVVAPAPFVEERCRALPAAITGLDADTVLLQEIYEPEHRDHVMTSLAEQYPHIARCDTSGFATKDHGLMILSKHPLSGSHFTSFNQRLFDERLSVKKGFISTVVDAPVFGRTFLTNAHTTAGGLFRHPERKGIDAVRQTQLYQILAAAKKCGLAARIIGGDLNTGPEVSRNNYDSLLAAGYLDAYAATEHVPDEPTATWDPKNPLNSNGPHRMCPPQRIDHVLVSGMAMRDVIVSEASIVLYEPSVEVQTGKVTFSDHYGFLARFARS